MTRWRLRCTECGREWILAVSYDLASMGKIYHYCPYCKKNTFHIVIARIEDDLEENKRRAENSVRGEKERDLLDETG